MLQNDTKNNNKWLKWENNTWYLEKNCLENAENSEKWHVLY